MAGRTEGRRDGELLIGDSRFALLYNVQGLKYTIGQRFESRRRQGEFLFCFEKGVAKTSHCEITSESGGQFWVKDLQGLSGNGTFINGKRIEGRVELKFGDVLTLGDPTSSQGTGEMEEDSSDSEEEEQIVDGCTVFLFQAAETAELELETKLSHLNVNGESSPLTNTLVLSKIFGYLPLSDVKHCRLVCSQWKEEATKLLKSNSVTNFEFHNHHPNYRSLCALKSCRLFQFVQEMGGFFPGGRFCVTLPTCVFPNYICKHCADNMNNWSVDFNRKWNCQSKMVADLKWFFGGGYPHPVTKLSLGGTLRHKPGYKLSTDILKGCSLHLEDLTLIIQLNLGHNSENTAPFTMDFPSLKTLEISLQRSGYGYDHSSSNYEDDGEDDWDTPYDKIEKWITSLITSAPGVQSLKLTHYRRYRMQQNFGHVFLAHVIKEKGFPNLNSLELFSYNWRTLDCILKLPQLKSLKLDVSSPSDAEIYVGEQGEEETPTWTELMGRVLEKSATTLKYLELALPHLHPLRYDDRGYFSLPKLPNLKVLKLRGFYPNSLTSSDLGLKFEGLFPTLKHFEVQFIVCEYVKNHRDAEGYFFEIFFPWVDEDEDEEEDESNETSDDETGRDWETGLSSSPRNNSMTKKKSEVKEKVVESVQFLNIHGIHQWSNAGVERMDKLFPNAFNKQVAGAELLLVKKLMEDWFGVD